MDSSEIDYEVLVTLQTIAERMKIAKPDDRSEKARRVQIAITDLEKVMAYWKAFVMESDG